MKDYIEINTELVPYQFYILLADEWFELYVNYNKTADLFTLTVYKDDELVTTEPLVLDVPLFRDTYQPFPKGFPSVTLVPYDPSGTAKSVTFDNLNKNVFLVIDDEDDENE